jgi:osmotically-inducible protein OsmY
MEDMIITRRKIMRTKRLTREKFLQKLAIFGLCLSILLVGGSVAVAQNVEEKDITSHIESEYWQDESVPSNAINVVTTDGIVTLSGSTDNILAKDRAQAIAEATVGVRAVVNRIQVLPPVLQTDAEIRKNIDTALLNDAATDSYEVKITVKDGIATLTGTVDSWQEKDLCETVTKGVKGVTAVNNQITVDYKTKRPDDEIEAEVKARLANDVRVDDALIDVAVNDAKVFLSGNVGSVQEKNRAIIDSWVGGVESVDADALDIKWWIRDEMRRHDIYTSQTDSDIQQAVKDAFLYDPRVLSFDIKVDVSFGTVTLSGIVDNLEARQAAEADAKNTMGVVRVINNIKVRPVSIPSSEDLKNRVASVFVNDPYIERFKMDISAYGGTVYLSGDVNTSWEKHRATRLAEGVKGVLSVVNNIDFEQQWTWKPDWEILADVKDEIFWSPFVDADKVTVTVDDGVITLNGTVSNYSERQSAEDNAYEGGAKDVRNKLEINYEYYGPTYPGIYGPYYYPGDSLR